LPETTPKVQEGLVLALEPGEERRVMWVQRDGEVEEAELAYAGVGPDLPGAFTLWGPS
jgi:hypothetical protein